VAVTISAVKGLEPGETIWDEGGVAGFGVRRQRDSATYFIKYRFAGQQRFVTIGRHGSPWTPEQARREAKRLLGLVAADRDPHAEHRQARERSAETLSRVAEEYLARAKGKLKPRSYVEVERHLRKNWARLGGMSVFKLTRRQVAAQLAEIEGDKGPVTAARARAALSAMFNWAIREGYEIAANPVAGTNRPPEPKSRSRVLTDAELARVWQACGDNEYGRIVRLLILTGQRREEVGGMHWSEINAPEGLWLIAGERTKNHREHAVPLTPAALALLPPPRTGDFVFGQRGFNNAPGSACPLNAGSAQRAGRGRQGWRGVQIAGGCLGRHNDRTRQANDNDPRRPCGVRALPHSCAHQRGPLARQGSWRSVRPQAEAHRAPAPGSAIAPGLGRGTS
jgi:integrase